MLRTFNKLSGSDLVELNPSYHMFSVPIAEVPEIKR